jgi:type I restriction enzyme M protein
VGIATCIIVLKKDARRNGDNHVLFIDATKDCVKDGNKNRLTGDNQKDILTLYENREDVQYKSKLVSVDDILANDANLSVSSYVEQEDTREKIIISEVNEKLRTLVKEGIGLNEKIEAIIKELGE